MRRWGKQGARSAVAPKNYQGVTVPGFSLVTIESRSCQHGQASCASCALSRRPAIALQLHSARKPDLPVAGGHSRSAYRMLWPMLPSTTTQTSRRRSSIGERRWRSAMVRVDAVCAGPHECTNSISTTTGPACSATRGKGKPHERLEGRERAVGLMDLAAARRSRSAALHAATSSR